MADRYPFEEDELRPETAKPVASAPAPPLPVPSFDDALKQYEGAESRGFAPLASLIDATEEKPAASRLPDRPKDVDPFDFSSPRTQEQAVAATDFLRGAGVYGDPRATETLRSAYQNQDLEDAKAAQRSEQQSRKAAIDEDQKNLGIAMDVMAGAGVEFESVPGGQKRAKRHADGGYVYKPDWVSDPRYDKEKGAYLRDYRDERGQVAARDLWAEKILKTDKDPESPTFGKVFLPGTDDRKEIIGENQHFLRLHELSKQLARESEDEKLAGDERDLIKQRITDELRQPWSNAQSRLTAAQSAITRFDEDAKVAPSLRKDPTWSKQYADAQAELTRVKAETRPAREQYEAAQKRIAAINADQESRRRRLFDLTMQRRSLESEPERPEFYSTSDPMNESADVGADREMTGIGGDAWQIPDIAAEKQDLTSKLRDLDEEGRSISASANGVRMTVGGLQSKLSQEQQERLATIFKEKRELVDRFTSRTSAVTKFEGIDADLSRKADAILSRAQQVSSTAEKRVSTLRAAVSSGRLDPDRAQALAQQAIDAAEPLIMKGAEEAERLRNKRLENRKALHDELAGSGDIPRSLITMDANGRSLDADAFQRRVVGRAAALGQREADAFLDVAEEIKKRGDITHVGTQPIGDIIRTARTAKGAKLTDILNPDEAKNVLLGLRGNAAAHLPALLHVRYRDVVESRKMPDGGVSAVLAKRPTYRSLDSDFLGDKTLSDPVGPTQTALQFLAANVEGAGEKAERNRAYADVASYVARLNGRISRLPAGDEQRSAIEREVQGLNERFSHDPEFQEAFNAAKVRRNAASRLARMDSAYMDRRKKVLGTWLQTTSAGVRELTKIRGEFESKHEAMLERFSPGERAEIEESTRTERVLNALDTGRRRLNAYDKINDIIDRPSQLVPFFATAVEIPAIVEVSKAAKRLEEGKASADDAEILAKFVAKDSQERTLWYNVLDVTSMLPAFAGELASTGGLYSGGKAVASAGAKAALRKLAGEGAAEGVQTFLAKQAAGKTVGALATRLVTKGAASLAGSAAQAPVASGVRIVEGAIRRAMPQVDGLSENEHGNLEFVLKDGDQPFEAALKAAGDQYVEVFSEHSGKAFDILGSVAGKALPKAVREPLSKVFLFGKWAEKNPGATPSTFRKFLNDAGWNGVLQEIGEERVGDLARAFGSFVTDVANGEDIGSSARGAASGAVPSWEQLATEAIAFSIPGAAISGASALSSRREGGVDIERARRDAFDVLDQKYLDLSEAVRSRESLAVFNAKLEANGTRPLTMEAARDVLRDTSEARSSLALDSLLSDEDGFAARVKTIDPQVDTAKAVSDLRNSADRLGAIVAVGDQLRDDGAVSAGAVNGREDAIRINLAAGQTAVTGIENVLRGGKIPLEMGMALKRIGLLVQTPIADGQTEFRVSLEGLSLLPPSVRREVANAKGGSFKIMPVGASGEIARALSQEGNRLIGSVLRSDRRTAEAKQTTQKPKAENSAPVMSDDLTRETLAGSSIEELRSIARAHSIEIETPPGEPPLTGSEIARRILVSTSSGGETVGNDRVENPINQTEVENLEGADENSLSAITGTSAPSAISEEQLAHRVAGETATDAVGQSLDVANAPDVDQATRAHAQEIVREVNARRPNGAVRVTARIVAPYSAMAGARRKSTIGAGKFVTEFENAFGKKVLFLKFSEQGAPMAGVSRANPDVLFVNVDAPAPLQMLVGHEFAHALEMDRPDIYKPLEQSLLALIRGRKEYAGRLRRQGYPIDRLNAETIGNIIGDHFDSPDFWRELATRDGTTFQRLARAAIEFLQRMIDRFRSFTWGTSEFLEDVNSARSVIADALSRYAADRRAESHDSESGETSSRQSVEFALPPVPPEMNGIIDGPLNRAVTASVRAAGQMAKGVSESEAVRPIVQELAGLVPDRFAEVAAGAIKLVKREIIPGGTLPAEAAALIRESVIADSYGRHLGSEWARILSNGAESQMLGISVPPRLMNAENRRLFNDVLTGDRQIEELPPALQPIATRVRQTIDNLGRRAVDAGLLAPETYERGKGTYLPRLYRSKELMERGLLGIGAKAARLFLDRTSNPRLSDAYAILKGEKPVNHSPGKFRFDGSYERDSFFDRLRQREVLRWLKQQGGVPSDLTEEDIDRTEGLPKELRARIGRLKSKFAATYTKSDPISEETLTRMGLIREPGYPVAKAIIQMNHDIVMAGLFRQIAAKSEWISDVDSPGFTRMPDNPRWGDLAGKFVNEDIAHELNQIANAPDLAIQVYDGALRVWKKWKTVYNPATHGRNVVGNILFADLAGVNPLDPFSARYYVEAINTLRGHGRKVSLDELYREGVLGADFTAAELQDALEGVELDPETLGEKAFNLVSLKSVRRFAERAYQLEDEIFKIAGYVKARELGMTPKEATTHVRKWFPFYDQIPKSMTIAVGRRVIPFISFFYEATRIAGAAMAEKPFTLAKWMAVPSLITLYSLTRLGLDDDDREAVLSQMRGKIFGWPVFSALMPFRDDQGRPVQWDLTNVIPYAQPLGLRLDRSEEKNPMWQDMMLTLLTSNPVTNIAIGVGFNQDAFTGRELRVAGMSPLEEAQAVGAFVGKTVLPPLTPGVGTTWNTITAPERSKGTLQKRDQGQAILRGLAGVDLRSAAPSLYRAIEEFQKANGYSERPERFGETNVSRSKGRLYEALVNDDQSTIERELRYLANEGVRFTDPKDIQSWINSRHPIRGAGRIKSADIDRFVAGLTPIEREQLELSVTEFNRVLAVAPSRILGAQAEVEAR